VFVSSPPRWLVFLLFFRGEKPRDTLLYLDVFFSGFQVGPPYVCEGSELSGHAKPAIRSFAQNPAEIFIIGHPPLFLFCFPQNAAGECFSVIPFFAVFSFPLSRLLLTLGPSGFTPRFSRCPPVALRASSKVSFRWIGGAERTPLYIEPPLNTYFVSFEAFRFRFLSCIPCCESQALAI